MNRYPNVDLRAYLDSEFMAAFSTTTPEDEQVRDLYRMTQKLLYPTRYGVSVERNKKGRYNVMKLRRALEQEHPWLRQDVEVRAAEATSKPVQRIDVVMVKAAPPSGLLVLVRAKKNGNNKIMEWENIKPAPPLTGRGTAFDPIVEEVSQAGHQALTVLLGHLWHFEHIVDGETEVRRFRIAIDPKSGAAVPVPAGSAMQLSDFIEGLR